VKWFNHKQNILLTKKRVGINFHEFHEKSILQARLPWLCDTTSSAGQPEPESTENDGSGAGDLGCKVEWLGKL